MFLKRPIIIIKKPSNCYDNNLSFTDYENGLQQVCWDNITIPQNATLQLLINGIPYPIPNEATCVYLELDEGQYSISLIITLLNPTGSTQITYNYYADIAPYQFIPYLSNGINDIVNYNENISIQPNDDFKGIVLNWPTGFNSNTYPLHFILSYNDNYRDIIKPMLWLYPVWSPDNPNSQLGDIWTGIIGRYLAITFSTIDMLPVGTNYSLISQNEPIGDLWVKLNEGQGVTFYTGNNGFISGNWPAGLIGQFTDNLNLAHSFWGNSSNEDYYYFSCQVKAKLNNDMLSADIKSVVIGIFEISQVDGLHVLLHSVAISNGKFYHFNSGNNTVIGCYIAKSIVTAYDTPSNTLFLDITEIEFNL